MSRPLKTSFHNLELGGILLADNSGKADQKQGEREEYDMLQGPMAL